MNVGLASIGVPAAVYTRVGGSADPVPSQLAARTQLLPFAPTTTSAPQTLSLLQPRPSGFALRPARSAPELVASVDNQRLVTRDGTFTVSVSWATNDLNAPTVRGHLEFTPAPGRIAGEDDIAFVQIARVQLSGGIDYRWRMGEAPRTAMFTRASPGSRVTPGYYIDHMASEASRAALPSPFFRDYWPGEDEAADGVIRGGVVTRPASMVDYPFGWEHIERISLEACAISRRTGKNYGCVRWGAQWPSTGERQVFVPRASSNPSPTFDAAFAQFRTYYAQRPATESTREALSAAD